MKKIIFFILAFLIIYNLYSQNTSACGEIEYLQSTHFSRDFSRNFILKFNNDYSIYKELNILNRKEKIKQTDRGEGMQLSREVPRNNLTNEFYYNDREHFYFMEVWFDKELLVKEDTLTWNWILKDDTKKIGSFTCQKATILFRGRNYIAWFTEEIPVHFGPWKFQGLSGLILEIYDVDKVFHIVAKKVNVKQDSICEIHIDKSKFESALTINQFLKKKNKLIKEDLAILSSRLPKGYGTLKYDENCDDCNEEVEKFKNK